MKNIKRETENEIQFNLVFYQQQEQTKIHLSFENKIMSVHISKENCSSKYIKRNRKMFIFICKSLFIFLQCSIYSTLHTSRYICYLCTKACRMEGCLFNFLFCKFIYPHTKLPHQPVYPEHTNFI